MNRVRREQGMTLIGWVFTLAVLGFVVLVVLRLVPVYIEAFKVDSALESLIQDPGTGDDSREEILRKFAARMSIEDVDRFDTEQEAAKYLTVQRRNGGLTLRAEYQSMVPLVGNLSIVADWRKEVTRDSRP